MKTFPEINALNLRDAREALKLGRLNRDNVKPEFLADLDARLEAIEDRVRRLNATERSRKAGDVALRSNKAVK